jgi:hypothetical protein
MIRYLRDLAVLMRASGGLGRASRLEAGGELVAAADGYSDVLAQLDTLPALPLDTSAFTIRDAAHFSTRIVVVNR